MRWKRLKNGRNGNKGQRRGGIRVDVQLIARRALISIKENTYLLTLPVGHQQKTIRYG